MLRLGLLSVLGLGNAAADCVIAGRSREGHFMGIGDFLERRGGLEEVAFNLVDAGAFDSLQPNRRKAKWEIGLRYRSVNSQLALPLPVEQDMTELKAPGVWDRMKEEYSVLSLYPEGHIMEYLRPRFPRSLSSSRDIAGLRDGVEVTTAGMVIRRQRSRGKAVFITLEDEFGHIPLVVFTGVYCRNEHKFKSAFLMVHGHLARSEGTHNVVVDKVRPFTILDKALSSKDWQ